MLLEGGQAQFRYDTDTEELFKQESFFKWAFGVKEPGFFGAIEVGSGKSWLFMPRLPAEWAVWQGRIHPPGHFQAMYEVDEVAVRGRDGRRAGAASARSRSTS